MLGALYFLTPVLYPMSQLEGQNELLAWVIRLNPMSWYVQAMRDVMYSLVAPPIWEIGALLVGGFVNTLLGTDTVWLGSQPQALIIIILVVVGGRLDGPGRQVRTHTFVAGCVHRRPGHQTHRRR